MTKTLSRSGQPGLPWTFLVFLLVFLCVGGPLLFGLPVVGATGAADANFNLQIIQGYVDSLRGGDVFPRWISSSNMGLGSPVFYFYGRVPFLIAAAFALFLHVSASAGLLLGIGLFRLISFFTCRSLLRLHTGWRAADCGALLFLCAPFAMLLNPIGRVGYAEIAATALIPLLFLVVDSKGPLAHRPARQCVYLSLLYAALACCHLPQTLLAFVVLAVYLLCCRDLRLFFVNVGAAGLGLMVAGINVLPAVLMQHLITPTGWRGDKYLDIHNNFLFTIARYRVYSLFSQELYLYSTWLLCFAICAVAVRRLLVRGEMAHAQRAKVLLVVLLLCLVAMTELFAPLWIYTPLRMVQFPWRLFPAALVIAGALLALLVEKDKRRERIALACLGCIVVAQCFVPGLGRYVHRDGDLHQRQFPTFVRFRTPAYAPQGMRELPAYETLRSFPPEYLPATAHAAGWHVSEDQWALIPGEHGTAHPDTPPPGLIETFNAEGGLLLRGTLPAPVSITLPTFYFPDEQLTGSSRAMLTLDRSTGFTRITVPAGPVSIRVSHTAPTSAVTLGRIASVLGFLILAALLLLSSRRAPVARDVDEVHRVKVTGLG